MIENENSGDDQEQAEEVTEASSGDANAVADEAAATTPAEASEAGGQDILGKISGMLPEGALGKASQLLDTDGDGNPVNDLAGLAGKFLNRD